MRDFVLCAMLLAQVALLMSPRSPDRETPVIPICAFLAGIQLAEGMRKKNML